MKLSDEVEGDREAVVGVVGCDSLTKNAIVTKVFSNVLQI